MKKLYSLTSQQVHDAIQNMIRVFNEYRLDRKLYENNVYRVYAGKYFYNYQMFNTPEGTQLKVSCGLSFGPTIADEDARHLVEQFYSRLDQIISGQIALTPDVVNRDVYKSNQAALGVLTIVKLIVAAAAIIMGIMALSH